MSSNPTRKDSSCSARDKTLPEPPGVVPSPAIMGISSNPSSTDLTPLPRPTEGRNRVVIV